MTELELQRQFLDLTTGEIVPATVQTAAEMLEAIRDRERQLRDMKEQVTEYLREQSEIVGSKTLHDGGRTVELSGGPTVEYDAQMLMDGLLAAGCPQYRVSKAVGETVVYKPNRSVLRELRTNPKYARVIEAAAIRVEGRWYAKVKP